MSAPTARGLVHRAFVKAFELGNALLGPTETALIARGLADSAEVAARMADTWDQEFAARFSEVMQREDSCLD